MLPGVSGQPSFQMTGKTCVDLTQGFVLLTSRKRGDERNRRKQNSKALSEEKVEQLFNISMLFFKSSFVLI